MENIAILFGGGSNHAVDLNISYGKETYDHIVEPLETFFNVSIYVTCSVDEKNGWVDMFANYKINLHIECVDSLPVNVRFTRQNNQTIDFFNHKYHQQYGKLKNSFDLMKRDEKVKGVVFDYLIKGRSDFIYKNFFNPLWLKNLNSNHVVVSSTEWHTPDRWVERTKFSQKNSKIGVIHPHGMSDQFIFGKSKDMEHIFNIVSSSTKSPNGTHIHPEYILKQELDKNKINVLTVEFQFKKPWIRPFATHDNHEGITPEDPWVKTIPVTCWTGLKI